MTYSSSQSFLSLLPILISWNWVAKVSDDVRSDNGLGSRELEEEVTLATGKREEVANIRCDGWFCDRRQLPSTTSHEVGMARCTAMSVL